MRSLDWNLEEATLFLCGFDGRKAGDDEGVDLDAEMDPTDNIQSNKKRNLDQSRDTDDDESLSQDPEAKQPKPKRTCKDLEVSVDIPFEVSQEMAVSEGKWLSVLVSDQKSPVSINGQDLFSDPQYQIKSFLQEHHIFLKIFQETEIEQIFIKYELSNELLPILLIIDPRTGELKAQQCLSSSFYIFTSKTMKNFLAQTILKVISRFRSENGILVELPDSVDCSMDPQARPSTSGIKRKMGSGKIGSGPDEKLGVEDQLEKMKIKGLPEVKIRLVMEDGTTHLFHYNLLETVGNLINHIRVNYLDSLGIYNNEGNQIVLFSRIHDATITDLNPELTLEKALFYPTIVLFHNTNRDSQ